MLRNYRIEGKIADGAQGTVFRAIDTRTGHRCAIKRMPIAKKSLPRKAHEIEFQLCRRLKHSGVVRYLDHFQENGAAFLVMELVEGGDLFEDIVHRADYHEEEIRSCIYGLLHALNYMHMNGIAHRDIKPENILLRAQGDVSQPVLADFGFACEFSETMGITGMTGTEIYAPPEIFFCRYYNTPYDSKVDLWGIGVVMYMMIYKKMMYPNDGSMDLVQAISTYHYNVTEENPDLMSRAGYDLLRNLLQSDPLRRFSAAQALEHPWFADIHHTRSVHDDFPIIPTGGNDELFMFED
eukprot:TRINITY_DN188_c0_g5_i1.p1 TRINITY_DN188_c0_g5~~TRINITY_DN188_c0_g5_i1.p1  ORF type:complete len:295 (+),score=55.15 TRINITY_DN188_c0_g5_i1:480-1364(+)